LADRLTYTDIVYSQGPILQTEDGIEVFPFPHFADLLANQSL